MSDEDEAAEKSFEPTQKKLDDARAKGEFARSADLNTAASYGGFLLVAAGFGGAALASFGQVNAIILDQAAELSTVVFAGGGRVVIGGAFMAAVTALSALFLLPAVFALMSVLLQRALVFTPSKIAPKLSRISPLNGVKNKFGRQGLFEFAKSTAKLSIYIVILGIYLSLQIDAIIFAIHLPPAMGMAKMGQSLIVLFTIVFVVALTIGGVDYLWQRAEHLRKNRMSRKEMMDELKQAEGDPMLKQKRRARGQEIAMNKMLADVPQADVVIVNPTHFAVALRWDRAAGTAPVCVAKGVDEIAARIRELAIENAVPIHSDPPTARALHATVALGQEIAPEHYKAVAAAIRFAEAMRQKVAKR
jgi:flagellar biosynthetic protein FlhB